MATGILNVVIDERKKLSEVDEVALLQASRKFVAGKQPQKTVFKDYILSSDVFYIDTTN